MSISELREQITYPVLVDNEIVFPSSWDHDRPSSEAYARYERMVDEYFSWLALRSRTRL